MPTNNLMLRQQLSKYAASLSSFSSSSSNFRILHSSSTSSFSPPKTLYILDSSFNPPTLAHFRIATSAILKDAQPSPSPKRILLLLATQNADKAPKPASFEHRLTMMQILASDLLSSPGLDEQIAVDIGVTKLPYFIDKAKAIEESNAYPSSVQQVHMTGFDTLIRVLDSKYYPPDHSLKVLEPFFEKNRLRVTYRTDDEWGAREAQDNYLADLKDGKRDGEGGNGNWVTHGRIEMCEGRKEGEEIISSTKVRDAANGGDKENLGKLVTSGVSEWILENGLYTES